MFLKKYGALLLIFLFVLTGCQEEKKLYHGLGDSLRKTVKSSMADAKSLPEQARSCKCIPTCIIALKQHVTRTSFEKQLFQVGAAVVNGAITALPVAQVTKTALKRALAAATKASGKEAITFKGHFTQYIEWEQSPEFNIDKTCDVNWFGFFNSKTNKVTVILNCNCANSRCALQYTYKVNADKLMVGSAQIKALR